ncbi:MAG: glycosyltransferase family 39 protein, partial [Planctomycetes bacterium]|nr:glycosyltransferase family 39 protein [Planctomycetota bacterium]
MDQPGLAARSPRAPWWRLALAFWLVAQLAVAALLLHAERLPPVNDEFHYYAAGRRLAAAVSAFLSTAEPGPLAAALVDGATHRPNGLALWGAAWSAVLPPAPQMARLLSFFFLALLVFAIRDVGARLFGEPAGSLAAFVLSTCPLAFGHARLFMANLPATAMAAAAAAALLRSERFARLGPSLVVGAFFGAGMLLRLDFPVEAAAALGAAVLALPGGEAVPLARRARNALAAAGVALALCGPWYAVN